MDYEIDSNEIETVEELADYFVEQRTAINELELRMWHKIGEVLYSEDEQEVRRFAKLIKKHLSEVKTAILFFREHPIFEDFPFNKATTWTSVKEQFGTREKRERKTLKEVVKQRYEKNISQEDTESRIRAEEDKAILSEVENGQGN